MKIYSNIIIIILLLAASCRHHMSSKQRSDSVARQKKTINQSCPQYEGHNSVYADQHFLVDEPKSVTEKKFSNYILSNDTNGLLKTGITLNIVFQPNLPPCCRQTVVVDTLKMDAKQVEMFTDIVLKYPVFNQVQFDKGEKIKTLFILMSRHKKGELSVGFR